MRRVFDTYDEDRSNEIEREEFYKLMVDLICAGRLKDCTISDGVLEDFFLQVDHDGSGAVDFDEFCEWWFYHFKTMGGALLPSPIRRPGVSATRG